MSEPDTPEATTPAPEPVELEDALWDAHERLSEMTQGTAVAIWALDLDGRVVRWNGACRRMFGYTAEETLGNVLPIVSAGELDSVRLLWRRVTEGHGFTDLAVTRVHRDGTPVELNLSAVPVDDKHGDRVGILVMGARADADTPTVRREADPRQAFLFESLVRSTSHVFAVVTAEQTFRYLSPAAETLFGVQPQELIGRSIVEVVHPEDAGAVALRALGTASANAPATFRVSSVDRGWRWVEAVASDFRDQPVVQGFILTLRDVTDHRRVDRLLRSQTRVLELVARGAPFVETLDVLTRLVEEQMEGAICTVMLAEHDAGVLMLAAGPSLPAPVVEAFHRGVPMVTGPGGACGTAAEQRRIVIVEDVTTDPLLVDWRDLALANDLHACWSQPIFNSSTDEVLGTFAMYYRQPRRPSDRELEVLDAFGHLAGIVIERQHAAEQMAHQALHDPLTGIPNRVLLLDRLGHAVDRLRRQPGLAAVLFCDLDRFKVVNDSLGHDAGDRLLKAVAVRLQAAIRAGDTAARFGGDEFVLLCEDLSSEQEVFPIAERIAATMAEPFPLDGNDVFLTWSIGISVARSGDDDPEVLLRDADIAMYQAKARGKSRYEVFDDDMRRKALMRLDAEHALHGALERGELVVHYQPEVSLRSDAIVGVEALVRWNHPERGLVLPDQFIGVAEESGLIVDIGAFVIREACRQLCEWKAVSPALTMSINLSTRQLAHPDLIPVIARAIADAGVDPGDVVFEITETALMADAQAAVAVLRGIRALGVHLALDDFGTGYSSLSYLRQLPVSSLKLDRSFVTGLGTATGDTTLVEAIIGLGHVLGLEVVAEGVETEAELDRLRALGCDVAQGWLFARASAPDDLTASLTR